MPNIVLTEEQADKLIEAIRACCRAKSAALRAKAYSDFTKARRLVRDTYDGYLPEDLPLDQERLSQDLTVTRDKIVDDGIDQIEKDFSITVECIRASIGRTVKLRAAPKKPKPAPPKPKRKRAARVHREGPVGPRGRPPIVDSRTFHSLSKEARENLCKALHTGGFTLQEIYGQCGQLTRDQQQEVKAWFCVLRKKKLVECEGHKRSMRYKAAAGLDEYVKGLE